MISPGKIVGIAGGVTLAGLAGIAYFTPHQSSYGVSASSPFDQDHRVSTYDDRLERIAVREQSPPQDVPVVMQKNPEVAWLEYLLTDGTSAFSAVEKTMLEKSPGSCPTKENFVALYSSKMRHVTTTSLETFLQTFPYNHLLWQDVGSDLYLYLKTRFDESPTATVGEALQERLYFPSSEELAGQWNTETRKIFKEMKENALYTQMLGDFYVEARLSHSKNGRVHSDVFQSLHSLLPYIQHDVPFYDEQGRSLWDALASYSDATISEVEGFGPQDISEDMEKKVLEFFAQKYQVLEADLLHHTRYAPALQFVAGVWRELPLE